MTHRILIIDDQANIHDDYREVLEKKSDHTEVDDALQAFFNSSTHATKKNFHWMLASTRPTKARKA